MDLWSDLLSPADRMVAEARGVRSRLGNGRRPALLVVDPQTAFVGVNRPILESAAVYPNSLGDRAFPAVGALAQLLAAARAGGIPVFYSQSGLRPGEERFSGFKGQRRAGGAPDEDEGYEIVAELAPRPGEVVIQKRFPSAFFGTPLMAFLHSLGVDSLVVGGFSTAGCVRATVVDAVSYNFTVAVVAEATADRLDLSYKVNLMELNMKYADVISLTEALQYLSAHGWVDQR